VMAGRTDHGQTFLCLVLKQGSMLGFFETFFKL
jgi:hypothetical protein